MSSLFPQLREYVEARCGETESILPKRRTELDALAGQLRSLLGQETKLELLFICTHNSRRSHMGQVWAQVAAQHFGIDGVQTWSGGTEVTAFAPGAIAALQRAGLRIDVEEGSDTSAQNPVHLVQSGEGFEPVRCWSKRFADPANPQQGFVAIMTCTSADEACPHVPGAAVRVALPYVDPKASDGTPDEAAAYDRCCEQVAREMLYLTAALAEAS